MGKACGGNLNLSSVLLGGSSFCILNLGGGLIRLILGLKLNFGFRVDSCGKNNLCLSKGLILTSLPAAI